MAETCLFFAASGIPFFPGENGFSGPDALLSQWTFDGTLLSAMFLITTCRDAACGRSWLVAVIG